MLKSLYIKNYALIDSLEMDFGAGFSVITGETGAGKSIILGALSLILGQRADMKAIKQGESKCVIEGIFDISAYNFKQFYEEHEIDFDAKTCIIRREILSSGKSRAFINDSPVALNDLKELGEQLIDIHSQHENLLLADNRFQMQVVDTLAGNKTALVEYKQAFNEYKKLEKQLAEVKEALKKSKDEEDYIRFQYETLKEANLNEDEQEELESEQQTLNHAEEIKGALHKCYTLLSSDETGVVSELKEALNTMRSIGTVYNHSDEYIQRIESAYIDLKDMSTELERMAEDVEFNAERMAFVDSRLDTIYTLQKKYHVSSIQELNELRDDFGKKIEGIDSSDEQIVKLEKQVTTCKSEVAKLASQLSKRRLDATKTIEKSLIDRISGLGMPNVRFEIKLSPKTEADITGIDNLEFLFSANKNVPLQGVADIASGGEISRFMLCMKSMIAGATALPTIIFDEIDTGVSGEIADKMGNIMQDFGKNMQVIAITHLPQIAAKGAEHYKVYKLDDEDTTTTNLRKLSKEERLEEIARMLSGATLTDAALQNAKEMLKH